MRSLLLTAAIAASALATSLAADAAPLRRTTAPADTYMQDFTRPFQPSSISTGTDNPRLAQIESQLNEAERTINADQRHGYITASQAQTAREEDRLIYNAAL